MKYSNEVALWTHSRASWRPLCEKVITLAAIIVALGDSAENPRYIETLPKRGYRFIGKIKPDAPVVIPTLESKETAALATVPVPTVKAHWKEISHLTVKLHHLGFMYSPDGTLQASFTIDEIDTVAQNNKTYSGTFDFKVFDLSGNLLQEVQGTTAATRITVD
jgi:hypothetical protein